MDKSSHCILAPILFDAPNKNYVDDYNKVLSKYPDWEKKLIIVHISDIEYNERIKHRKNPSPKVKGSVYEIDQDKLNKSFDLSDKLLAVPEIKP